MRILVTGATGFLGGHIVRRLAERHEVVAMTRHCPGSRTASVSWVIADLRQELPNQQLPGRLDSICHLAQAVGDPSPIANDIFDISVRAVQRLLDYARTAGARRFVLASSGDIYGHRLGACRETEPLAPTSFYSHCKRLAELLLPAYAPEVSSCALRLFHPYGPGQSKRLVVRMIQHIRSGIPVIVHTDDRPRITPVFVDDVVRVVEAALLSEQEDAFNVAGDTAVSIRDLAHLIGEVLRIPPRFAPTAEVRGDLMGDNARMKERLGVNRLTPLREGIARTVASEEQAT